MRITAEVLLDSVNERGNRLVTMALEYPLFIHNQFMTHRVFSRCSSSARAIPTRTYAKEVVGDPAVPYVFARNQKGMSPGAPLVDEVNNKARLMILNHMDSAVKLAEDLHDLGVHKQWANRYLAPFAHIRVIVSATDWDNFFELRASVTAQEEIHILANAMLVAMQSSVPELRTHHAPMIMDSEANLTKAEKSIVSSARCARTSYLLHGSQRVSTVQDDIALFSTLYNEKHLSPMEHVAFDAGDGERYENFTGWIQFRSIYKDVLENEHYELPYK